MVETDSLRNVLFDRKVDVVNTVLGYKEIKSVKELSYYKLNYLQQSNKALFSFDKIIDSETNLFALTNPNNEILENNEMVFLKYNLLPHLDQFYQERIDCFKGYYIEKYNQTQDYMWYLLAFKMAIFLFSFLYIIMRINSVLLSNLVILRALTFITDSTLEKIIRLCIRLKSIFLEFDKIKVKLQKEVTQLQKQPSIKKSILNSGRTEKESTFKKEAAEKEKVAENKLFPEE